ncbi:hypothetical protein BZA77DRAFT_290006 [Pyronema omphalodes]|nr:hypothetical protein BZA77DRAFT_290006 [Pyronema omphalodes]
MDDKPQNALRLAAMGVHEGILIFYALLLYWRPCYKWEYHFVFSEVFTGTLLAIEIAWPYSRQKATVTGIPVGAVVIRRSVCYFVTFPSLVLNRLLTVSVHSQYLLFISFCIACSSRNP